ncbi:hypothetical protein AAFF_G00058970 [Aldrovandia affinis]|uniref:Uncharacterized protein n=1 Tax=Aldrovandia affinis TaxID=143900 RepID=A0AAD7S0J5_9TELE|nr:hypothetical protein AAFF_G00058970 [Aldrovandia affinis]
MSAQDHPSSSRASLISAASQQTASGQAFADVSPLLCLVCVSSQRELDVIQRSTADRETCRTDKKEEKDFALTPQLIIDSRWRKFAFRSGFVGFGAPEMWKGVRSLCGALIALTSQSRSTSTNGSWGSQDVRNALD